jgi:hypothetical protein
VQVCTPPGTADKSDDQQQIKANLYLDFIGRPVSLLLGTQRFENWFCYRFKKISND